MTVRQEFLTILDLMNDDDLTYALTWIKNNFSLQRKNINWDEIDEIEPDENDFILMEKIKNKADGYGEYITQDTLLKNLRG